MIHRARELGVTHLDTAIVYGNGHNESLVGGYHLSCRCAQNTSCRVDLKVNQTQKLHDFLKHNVLRKLNSACDESIVRSVLYPDVHLYWHKIGTTLAQWLGSYFRDCGRAFAK